MALLLLFASCGGTPSNPVIPLTTNNGAPTVSINGTRSCHPSAGGSAFGARPCSVTLQADARDPEGGALRYQWGGCASGTAATSTCEVRSLGRHDVTLTVTDPLGAQATATAVVEGVNRPPSIPQIDLPSTFPSLSEFVSTSAMPSDPDGDEGDLCDLSLSIDGPCGVRILNCGGGCRCLQLAVRTETGPGVCRVGLSARDSWGEIGQGHGEFRVEAPRQPPDEPEPPPYPLQWNPWKP